MGFERLRELNLRKNETHELWREKNFSRGTVLKLEDYLNCEEAYVTKGCGRENVYFEEEIKKMSKR